MDLQASFSADVSPEYGISSPDSPEDSGGNPFYGGVSPKKIGADSGKKLMKIIKAGSSPIL